MKIRPYFMSDDAEILVKDHTNPFLQLWSVVLVGPFIRSLQVNNRLYALFVLM